MFDLDLYSLKKDEKEIRVENENREDQFLSYIVKAIKYAAGEKV